jgi:type I restriction enzyme S subunit
LRFPEFSGEWEWHKLNDIATLSKGSGISKEQLSEFGRPCILYGELYTKYKSEVINDILSRTNINVSNLVNSKANDVIIPSSGESAIDIATARCVPFDNILLGGDLNIIRLHNNSGHFFSYQLNGARKHEIAKVAQGVSVVHLYGENLRKLKVATCSIEEQEKIASFLSLLDQRISTQNKIIEQYKSLIKGIYTYLLRDSDKYRKLGEICQIKKGEQINRPELLDDSKYYVMNGGITSSGFYHSYNTEANTISISEGGNSCGYVQYNDMPFWSGGHCYTLENIENGIDDRYLFHYLKANEHSIMALRIGSGLPNIQKKDLSHFCVPVPSWLSQKEISNILDKIILKIELEKSAISSYQKQKIYLLQNIFI